MRGFRYCWDSVTDAAVHGEFFVRFAPLAFPPPRRGLAAGQRASRTEDAVVCLVDGEPIRAGEVTRLLSSFTRGEQITAEGKPIFQAQTLEEIVNRRLVLAYAKRSGTAPTDDEIAAAVSGSRRRWWIRAARWTSTVRRSP